jgi:hypothetical protein
MLPFKLPDFQSSQAYMAYPDLANALFGDDALTSDRVCLKGPVRRFLESLTLIFWQSNRGSFEKSREKMDMLYPKVESSWKGMKPPNTPIPGTHTSFPPELSELMEEGKRPDVKKLLAWVDDLSSLISIVRNFRDAKAVTILKEQRDRLKEMLNAMGIGKGAGKRAKSALFLPRSIPTAT